MAVQKVKWFLNSRLKEDNWIVDENVLLGWDEEFAKELPAIRTFKDHRADLGIFARIVDMNEPDPFKANKPEFKLLAIIEIGGNVGFWYMSPFSDKPKKANPSKHSKPRQQKNDKIVKNWCENNYIKYITLLKEEILGDCKADKEYWLTGLRHLQEHPDLQEWIR